jgi:hypothetical protein
MAVCPVPVADPGKASGSQQKAHLAPEQAGAMTLSVIVTAYNEREFIA